MSLKPDKKSDAGKSWMKSRRDRRRTIAPEYHLIVTEGEKTEPLYFESLKAEINHNYPNRINIKICGVGQGYNTLTLLDYAIKTAEKDGMYKHIWVVYDKDDFPDRSFDGTVVRCRELSNESVVYHALWSNECIELWFLLHFIYLQSDIPRHEYYQKLTEYLKSEYKKNRNDMYSLLKPHLETAVRNAKKLELLHEGMLPSKSAPGTAVYEIFEHLKSYL